MGLDWSNGEEGILIGPYGTYYERRKELVLAALEYLQLKANIQETSIYLFYYYYYYYYFCYILLNSTMF